MLCFSSKRREGVNGGAGGGGDLGGSQCLCVCMWGEREKNTRREEGNWTHEMDERRSRFPQWQPEPRKHHRVCEEWKEVCMRMCVCVSSPTRTPGGLVDCCVFLSLFFGLLFLLFCLCYPSCVLFRLIGDLESRANSRQDILQTPWLQFGQIINSERQAFGQQEWKLESQIAVLSGFLLFLLKCLTEVWIPHKHKRLHWSTRGDTDQKFKPALQTQLCSVWLVLKGQTFPVDGKVKNKVFSVIMLCIYLKFFCVSKFLKCFLL